MSQQEPSGSRQDVEGLQAALHVGVRYPDKLPHRREHPCRDAALMNPLRQMPHDHEALRLRRRDAPHRGAEEQPPHVDAERRLPATR